MCRVEYSDDHRFIVERFWCNLGSRAERDAAVKRHKSYLVGGLPLTGGGAEVSAKSWDTSIDFLKGTPCAFPFWLVML